VQQKRAPPWRERCKREEESKKSNDTYGISYLDIERTAFTAHEATHEDLFDAALFFGN